MPCYAPLKGWVSNEVNEKTGKRSIVFSKPDALTPLEVSLPCGKCIGCRLDRARQWAVRCVHEASLYEDNCFITLTFDDLKSKPISLWSLYKPDFQKFIKRLRKRFGSGVRYYHCGEYGEVCGDCGLSRQFCRCGRFKATIGRPHHHACLFNFDFKDKVFWKERDGVKLYRSQTLEELWPFGHSTIGDVTFESAGYVARYIVKKYYKNPKSPDKHMKHYDGKLPEYCTMSRKPGIGLGWFEKFKGDCFPHDFLIVQGGKRVHVPKYYESKYELTNKDVLDMIKLKRNYRAFNCPDNTPERLAVREKLHLHKAKQLTRGIE